MPTTMDPTLGGQDPQKKKPPLPGDLAMGDPPPGGDGPMALGVPRNSGGGQVPTGMDAPPPAPIGDPRPMSGQGEGWTPQGPGPGGQVPTFGDPRPDTMAGGLVSALSGGPLAGQGPPMSAGGAPGALLGGTSGPGGGGPLAGPGPMSAGNQGGALLGGTSGPGGQGPLAGLPPGGQGPGGQVPTFGDPRPQGPQGPPGPGGQVLTPEPPPKPTAPPTPIAAGDWAKLGLDPNKISDNAPIPGQPGKVARHDASIGGWVIADAAPSAPPPPLHGDPPPGGPLAPPPPTGPAAPPPPILTADAVTDTTTKANQPPQTAPTSIAQSFQQALIDKLNPGAVDQNNPAIKGAIQANQLAEQRGLEAQRNLTAEQAARDGTDLSGGFGSLLRGQAADSAARQGQYAGDAVQHQSDQQNQNLLAALGMGGNFLQTNAARAQQGGQFSQTLAEQKRQSDVDAELKKLGINTQGGLGAADISLRGRLGDQQTNLGLLSTLLNSRYQDKALNQQGSQFSAGLDQSGLMGLLGLL